MTPMTVGDLLEALKDLDPSLRVVLEGCDCDGNLIMWEADDEELYLRRTTVD